MERGKLMADPWKGFESDSTDVWKGFESDKQTAAPTTAPEINMAGEPGIRPVENPVSSPFETPINPSLYIEAPYGQEYDSERIYYEYMMAEEIQKAKDEEERRRLQRERQPEAVPMLQPGERDNYAPGTPEYEEAARKGDPNRPGTLTAFMAGMRNKSPILGDVANFLTGCIDASVYGGNPVDYYRDYNDADHKTVMDYKPNSLQDIATTVAGVTAELPIFNLLGGAYAGSITAQAYRQATRTTSDYLVRGGSTRQVADYIAKNAWGKISNITQGGTVIAGHSSLGNFVEQFGSGKDLGEIDYGEILDTFDTMFKVGSATSMVGLGGNYIQNSKGFVKLVDGSVKKKMATMGVQVGDLFGQTSVFTIGDVMMDGDASTNIKSLNMDDYANAVSTLLTMKFTNTRVPIPKGRGGFSPTEVDAISKKVDGFDLKKPWESFVGDPAAVRKIMNDSSIPYTTKMKLSVASGIELPFPLVSKIDSKVANGKHEVNTYTKDGVLIQKESFSSKAESDSYLNQVELAKAETDRIMDMSKLSAKDKAELDGILEKAGIEGGSTSELLMAASMTPKSYRTPGQRKLANQLFEAYDNLKAERAEKGEPLKYEEREAPELVRELSGEELTHIVEQEVTKYTPQEIELSYETVPRLQTKINHPEHGIDKLLSDVQAIRESGDYSKAAIHSKTMRQHLPGTLSSTVRVKSEAQLNVIEGKLKLRKDAIEAELARRTTEGEPALGEGKFVLGRKAFDNKSDLFRELDKFPDLEDLPEVHDFETMRAISDYEAARYGKGIAKAQEVERVAGHAAAKIRQLKRDNDPGTLQITVPGSRHVWNFAVESTALAIEKGAKLPRAINSAINGVKKTTYYERLSEIEQSRLKKQLMDELTEAYEGRPIDPLLARGKIEEQIKAHEESNGSTFSVAGENLAGKDKGAVSIFPERSEILEGKLTADRLNDYIEKNKDLLEGNESTLAVDTRYDAESGKTYLDISSAVPIDKAFELGRKYNQKAIFDLKTMEEVSTGGTGEPVGGFPSESVRLKAIQKALGLTNPPKTSKQKQIDKDTGVTKKVAKIVVSEYTALKDQLRVQAKYAKDIAKFRKDAQAEIQKFIDSREFQSNLGVRATKTITRRVAGMDPTSSKSVDMTMAYIDKAITDAKFRQELADMDKAYDKLAKQTDPKSYQSTKDGIAKGKGIAPEYQDKIKKIRRDMYEADWNKAQTEIDALQQELVELNPGDPKIDAILDRIDELSFHGLLNGTSNPELGYMHSKLGDIASIRKTGRSIEAGRRFVQRGVRDGRAKGIFDVMNSGKQKAVLSSKLNANLSTPTYKKITRFVDWTALDSWFSLLDKMSRYDKSSKMYESYLSRVMGDYVANAERVEYAGLQEVHTRINTKASEIFGSEESNDLIRVLDSHTKPETVIEWVDAKGQKQSYTWSQNQIYKRWMELQDIELRPSLTDMGYFDKFGEKTTEYKALEAALDPKVKKWAEFQLNELYPELHAKYNEMYRQIFGTDMPMHGNYSPIFVADKSLSSTEALESMLANRDVRGLSGNSHMKLRTPGHGKELKTMDGDKVLMNYIDKMEFFRAWAEPLREMNNTFNRPEIRQSMEQIFGKQYPKSVDWFLKKFAREFDPTTDIANMSNFIRKNFTVGSLALKPTVFAKQLISFPAYADRIPMKDFMAGMGDWFNPKNWSEITEVLNSSEFLRERYQKGWDRDVMAAMKKDATKLLAGKNSTWKDKSMFLTKYGDKGAIIFGGWPVYKYHYNKAIEAGRSVEDAKSIAMREFEFATRQSQQSSNTADLSRFQNDNPVLKLATMYKTSPLQYHRKVIAATKDFIGPGRNRMQDVKTILIYHGILPQLFQLVSNGFQWDGKDQVKAVMWGNFNAIPILGDFAKSVYNHFADLPFGYQLTPVEDLQRLTVGTAESMGDMWSMINDLGSTDFGEIWEALGDVANFIAKSGGNSVDAVYNTVSGVSDALTGDTDYAARRILGWSENVLDDDRYDLLRDLPLDVIDAISGILNDDTKSWSDNDTVTKSNEQYDKQWEGFD